MTTENVPILSIIVSLDIDKSICGDLSDGLVKLLLFDYNDINILPSFLRDRIRDMLIFLDIMDANHNDVHSIQAPKLYAHEFQPECAAAGLALYLCFCVAGSKFANKDKITVNAVYNLLSSKNFKIQTVGSWYSNIFSVTQDLNSGPTLATWIALKVLAFYIYERADVLVQAGSVLYALLTESDNNMKDINALQELDNTPLQLVKYLQCGVQQTLHWIYSMCTVDAPNLGISQALSLLTNDPPNESHLRRQSIIRMLSNKEILLYFQRKIQFCVDIFDIIYLYDGKRLFGTMSNPKTLFHQIVNPGDSLPFPPPKIEKLRTKYASIIDYLCGVITTASSVNYRALILPLHPVVVLKALRLLLVLLHLLKTWLFSKKSVNRPFITTSGVSNSHNMASFAESITPKSSHSAQYMKCHICMENCMEERRYPTVTTCGHVFCWECVLRCIVITGYPASEHAESRAIDCIQSISTSGCNKICTCPVCRQRISLCTLRRINI